MDGMLPNSALTNCNGIRRPRQYDSHGPYLQLLTSAAKWAPARHTACLAATALLLLFAFFSRPGVRYQTANSLGHLFGTCSSSNHGPITDFVVSNSNGFCRLEYLVATFDGGYAQVCNPQLCIDREKLKVLEAASGTRRWSAFDENQYMNMYHQDNISGWLQDMAVSMRCCATWRPVEFQNTAYV
eukprot:GHUV01033033.1.p1 GENE.GHUV01033033.1~~GHUV01033033.1.p1  ORF type:complete len:185 (+),score=48.67 GHUV01033033.1:388-942(+)